MIRTILLAGMIMTGSALAAGPSDGIRDLENGALAFSFPARDGVRGNAERIEFILEGDENESRYVNGRWDDHDEVWAGDIHALLTVRRGKVREIELTVLREGGERPRSDRDLGVLSPRDASAFFLDLAGTAREDVAEEALLGLVVARDVEPAAGLIALVRDRDRPGEVRESALFWLAVLAGEEAAGTMTDLIDDETEDLELREHAVFALTQLDEDRAFPLLMDLARHHDNHELRRSAFIWLAQYDRPDVVNLFEEILVAH